MRKKKVVGVNEITSPWLSNEGAQKYLGKSDDFMKSLRENGKLHYYRVGRSIFYLKDDIDNLILNNRVV